MKIRLVDLHLQFKGEHVQILFTDFNYFYGQMGSGKSSIVRLIDYCLGGDMVWTPALQSEFISASLSLLIVDTSLVLSRDANVNQIRAHWGTAKESFEVLIPARKPNGEVLPGTGVEILSDLIFHLTDRIPPKVRRSKIKEDSELERLSLRDLLWYCYLDQDDIDSTFFNLDADAHPFRRLKSRDVLRFLVGFHQEQVAELEAQLELKKAERLHSEASALAIRQALSSSDLVSDDELSVIRLKLESELREAKQEIVEVRNSTSGLRSHAMDESQTKARNYSQNISLLRQSIEELRDIIEKDKTHKNELLSLSTRFRRSQSARAVLSGVEFKDCPRCGSLLPPRSADVCSVCGESHGDLPTSTLDDATAEKDLEARVQELTELISRHEKQLSKFNRKLRELSDEKSIVDSELTRISTDYDSTYLAGSLEAEKRHAALQQQLVDLKKLEALTQKITEFEKRAQTLEGQEKQIRSELKESRNRAERDTGNLTRLKELFLDCLIQSKIPGFLPDDIVEMKAPNFLVEVLPAGSGDIVVTSFANLGSGGKKTLFKCCFAVAMHRLAVEIGASLPTFLIIDSPMKNISERENRDQFEGFHQMLYDLSQTELKGTQFVLIDKELCVPPGNYEADFNSRHMKPDDENDPPLIPYYRGK